MSVLRNDQSAGRRKSNIDEMLLATALPLIFTELTSIVAVFIDGITASRFLGTEVYSGISLLKPYTSMYMILAGFLSTGCSITCSRLVGTGQKEDANGAFNITSLLALLSGIVVILLSIFFPSVIFRICGVSSSKYPNLIPYMRDYMHGLMIGIPATMLVHVMGPLFVMDNGKRLFTVSSLCLCVVDITGDLLNVFVFRGGAFGMGLTTSISHLVQLLILFRHFLRPEHYFRLSPKLMRSFQPYQVFRNGTPSLIKEICTTLRDILTNNINVLTALSAAAIAARGIQLDIYTFLLCIPLGLGKSMVSMTGIFHSANDRRALDRLYCYTLRVGFILSAITAGIVFIGAPLITNVYTRDPEVVSMAVFSIRCVAVSIVFDTSMRIHQNYLQGIGNLKMVNLMNFGEKLSLPVISAAVLGRLYGSRGVLASIAFSSIVLLLFTFITNCIRSRGIPKRLKDVMFLPEDFGGAETDNIYAEIRTTEDAIQNSEKTKEFCLQHGTGTKTATLMALFVEEMSADFLADLKDVKNSVSKTACLDYRIFTNGEDICFSMMDRINHLNASTFYNLQNDENPEAHLGIKILLKQADDVRYFTAYGSNNLVVHMKRKD